MAYTNTWEPEGLYRKFTGKISGEEIFVSNLELQNDANFQKINYIVNDFTEISGHTIAPSHTEIYAKTDDIISLTKGDLKIALVVDQTQISTIALAGKYCEQMKNKPFKCDIFPTLDEAREWVSNPSPGEDNFPS